MRRARVKAEGEAFYHVMSRCALQQFLLGDNEVKGMFLKILRRAEYFSGVKIIDYCIMDNHFHLLLKVPERQKVSDDALDDRIRVLYGAEKASRIFGRWDILRELGSAGVVAKERDAFRKRMFDLSEFMKTFKQRFSLWYCSNHGNLEGTIWQGPFHSVLVEGRQDALAAISAYITLNPVRAKIVDNPGDYAWCGYGAACSGDRKAKSALLSVYAGTKQSAGKWEAYRGMVEEAMAAARQNDCASKSNRNEAMDDGNNATESCLGKVPKTSKAVTVMCQRNRDVSRGVAFGSEMFVSASIMKASRKGKGTRTFPKAFCMGERQTPLYCAGRHRA